MALTYQPRLGAVLRCDFTSMGWMEPEMVKHRDVVVIARNRGNTKLVTVVPLSTTAPKKVETYHAQLSENPQPDGDPNTAVWAKCDMVYTVSIDRLDLYYKRTRRGREGVIRILSHAEQQAIRDGVSAALDLASPLGSAMVAPAPPPKSTADHNPVPVGEATAEPSQVPAGHTLDGRKRLSLPQKTSQNAPEPLGAPEV
jgi:uncharacterized protein YifN (PemK superfamily)